MSYVELLATLSESNLPPGGLATIRELITLCHLGPHSTVLHAGCNAGFLSREIARLSGARVTAIDISPDMVAAAERRARSEGLDGQVRHERADMRAMGFPDGSFSVTLSGGALAFVIDQPRAILEWIRVTRPYGIVADAELFYHAPAPADLRRRVAEIIGVPVPEYTADSWRDLFARPELLPYAYREARHPTRTPDDVKAYCRRLVDFQARDWDAAARDALRRRLEACFLTFNENLSYMSYAVMVFRRLPDEAEPLLFY